MTILPSVDGQFDNVAGKHCTKCGEFKPLDQFGANWRCKFGRFPRCKSCTSIYNKTRKPLTSDQKDRRAQYVRGYKSSEHGREMVEKHRKIRRQREREAGGVMSDHQWDTLCKFFGRKCLCCGESKILWPDHIIPVVYGGSSNVENRQPLCMECNSKKATKIIDYRPVIITWR